MLEDRGGDINADTDIKIIETKRRELADEDDAPPKNLEQNFERQVGKTLKIRPLKCWLNALARNFQKWLSEDQ